MKSIVSKRKLSLILAVMVFVSFLSSNDWGRMRPILAADGAAVSAEVSGTDAEPDASDGASAAVASDAVWTADAGEQPALVLPAVSDLPDSEATAADEPDSVEQSQPADQTGPDADPAEQRQPADQTDPDANPAEQSQPASPTTQAEPGRTPASDAGQQTDGTGVKSPAVPQQTVSDPSPAAAAAPSESDSARSRRVRRELPSGPATVEGVYLSNAITGIDITNSQGVSMPSFSWSSDARFLTTFDLTGRDVHEGDYFSFVIPPELTPKKVPDHFVATEVIDGENVNLADVYVTSQGDGSHLVKFVFRKDAEARQNIKGKFFVLARVTQQIEAEYDIVIREPDKEYHVHISVTPPSSTPLPGEHLAKWGESSATGADCWWGIRVNRVGDALQNVKVIDYIDPEYTLVQFRPESFKLRRVQYNDPVLSTGTAYTTLEEIPLVEGQNLFFENGYTKFTVLIPNVGTDSYYVSYSTTNPNDGTFARNHTQLVQNETEVIIPNGWSATEFISVKVKLAQIEGVIIESGIKQRIKIVKRDKDTYAPIANVVFNIRSEDGSFDQDYTTNSNGEILTDQLLNGKYIISEQSAPLAYFIPDANQNIEITLDEHGSIQNLFNERKKTEVTAKKVWEYGPFPRPKIWFKLYRQVGGGAAEAVPGAPLKALESDVETVKWEGLLATDDDGNPYTFSVEEVDADGNDWKPEHYAKSKVDALTVKNTYQSPKIDITGTKIWEHGPAEHPAIKLQLYRNGAAFGPAVDLPNGTERYTWTGLDKTDENGADYVYTVDEVEVPKHYIKSNPDGLTVKNTYVPPTPPTAPSKPTTPPTTPSKPTAPPTAPSKPTPPPTVPSKPTTPTTKPDKRIPHTGESGAAAGAAALLAFGLSGLAICLIKKARAKSA